MTAVINALDAAAAATQAARQEAKARTAEQNQKEDALDKILSQLASYVESIAGDDEAKIMSARMNVRSTQKATSDLSAPEGLVATAGDREGEIDLHWDKVDNARSYVIERSPDPITAASCVALNRRHQIAGDH